MGMNMSFMGEKGLSKSQMCSLITSTLYKQFEEKDIKDFDAFNVVILDIFNAINMALPNKHYDAPSNKDVMGLFKQWKEANDEAKKEIFTDFMNKNVNINKVDKSMIATAIVAPPAAMVAKRKGQSLPQLKLMKSIPDVVFVPLATILSLTTIKFLGTIFMGNKASKDAKDHDLQHSNSNNIPPPPRAQHHEPAAFVFGGTPEPSSSQQPETSTAQPPQQLESKPAPVKPSPTPAEQSPTPADPASSQQSVPVAAAIPLAPAAADIPLAPAPAAPQQSEPAVAHSPEHPDKENPFFCAICNRVH